MSSLKGIVKTRTYRERSQPAARAKLGLLEKHKDYKLRANDFHKKQDALNVLKEKAAFKNPDEFYYKMANTKTKVRGRRRTPRTDPVCDWFFLTALSGRCAHQPERGSTHP